jgi:hypothetical protein
MRTGFPSIAYQGVKPGSSFHGHWPTAGFSSIAYRLANLRVSRLGVVAALSMVFYLV